MRAGDGLVLDFGTWSMCLGVEVNLGSWILGFSLSIPKKTNIWPAYEFRIQIPTLTFSLEVITDASVRRALRAQEALRREFPEDRSPTPQDHNEEQ